MPQIFRLTDNTTGKPFVLASLPAVPNVAGGSPGAAVSTPIVLQDQYNVGLLPPPNNYSVIVTPSQNATAVVTGKTTSGFTVTLTPLSGTLAAGTFDVIVMSC